MHRSSEPAASTPTRRSGIRGLLGGATAAVLIAGGAAAVPAAAAAEEPQNYIVVLKDSVADVDAKAAEHKKKYALTQSHTYKYALKGYAGQMTASAAKRLGTDAAVDFVAPGKTFHLPPESRKQSSQFTPLGWLRITSAKDKGRKIKVNTAVIDTGIDSTHPELNVRGGVNCTSGTAVQEKPVDLDGHGTGVAGVLGAKNNNIGIIGTAPGIPLWSARIFDPNGDANLAAILCSIDWITSTRMDKDRTNDIDIANMSFENNEVDDSPNCGRGIDPVHMAICRSVQAGVTYVAAAGNHGIDFAGTAPATYDEVLTATAMADHDGKPGGKAQPNCGGDTSTAEGLDDHAATFSNYATLPADRKHTVAAPGVCMLTLFPAGQYTIQDGTSFSSPAVAGAVALCIANKVCKGSPKDVMKKFLEVTKEYNRKNPRYGFIGDPLRPIDNRYYGYLINRSIFEHGS
jgi:subtilisin family serine protease